MKVMVTGAGGMLAHAVLPLLREHGHEVLALTHAQVDVSRCEQVREHAHAFKPDWIVHLAAFTNVDACEREADKAYIVNGLGARNSSMAAADVGAGLIALSTDYVFDGASREPRREHDIVGPLSVYGRSKLAGERGAREVNIRHIIVRTQWLYGAGGRNFVDTVLAKARAGEQLNVVDDQTGAPTWTGDLAQALVHLMERGEYGTYHVASSGECSWHEFAAEICAQAGLEVNIGRLSSEELARPARRPAYSVLNNAWYRHVTGKAMPHWRDALTQYLKSGAA